MPSGDTFIRKARDIIEIEWGLLICLPQPNRVRFELSNFITLGLNVTVAAHGAIAYVTAEINGALQEFGVINSVRGADKNLLAFDVREQFAQFTVLDLI